MSLKLMKHQENAVDFAIKNNGIAAFFHEVGCGKTITSLTTYQRLKEENPTLKLLVICPLTLIKGAWTKELDKFFSQYHWKDLHSRDESNHVQPVDVYLTNFEAFTTKKRLTVIEELLSDGDWMCIVDESSRMKNNRTVTVKNIIKLRDSIKHRIIMSGTPAPNVE